MHKEAFMRKPFFMALAGLALVGCGPADDGGPSGPDAAPPINPCQLLSDPENTPGAPFDYQAFKNDILPQLQTTCGTAGCHGAPSANRLTVFTAGSCPDAETFNSMVPLVDYRVNVDNSILLKNLDGTDAHPIPYAGSPILTAVTAFLEDAFNRANGDGEPDITNFFNEDDYATQIQPALDAAGCIVGGCHD
jgi:hypothetical protein